MYEDLRKIRTERGIRLKECADVIGVQEACYCKKELGDLKFSLEEAKALAEFFKLPVEVLFFKEKSSKMERYVILQLYFATWRKKINAKPSNKSGGQQVLPGTTESGKVQRKALDESRSC